MKDAIMKCPSCKTGDKVELVSEETIEEYKFFPETHRIIYWCRLCGTLIIVHDKIIEFKECEI